ncbi:DeoR/GlpR family DNA-binding transcription regulator [Isoptericola croceus]|uniref:DeoR/GlpR family DNA-binding transcription regulator n=1 Tax=Isoptericola croceus TaxID=3031406 RepID=UPI0023F92BD1|nr:DeoR/GlpR family DNA-binding transcription regulator [Isoptericola croceus]
MRDLRERVILEHLRKVGVATVTELATVTGSSVATIRRDLQQLDRTGAVRRAHGGAVLGEQDAPFASVVPVNRDAKRRIAARAAELIQDGESVLLDIGTTTLHLARILLDRQVTVITASLAIYDALRDSHSAHLVMLPGDYDPVYRSVSGPLTTECLRLIRADHAFLGVSGVSTNGDLRDTTMAQVPIKQAISEVSSELTVLADHSKFPGTGVGRVTLPPNVARFITDDEIPEQTASALAAQQVEVVVV